MGEGKHLRFRVRERSRPAGSAIAFGLGPQLDRFRQRGHYDLAFRLEENRWNGTVAPQLVVRHVLETNERYHALRAQLAAEWEAGEACMERRGESDLRGARAGRLARRQPLRVGDVPRADDRSDVAQRSAACASTARVSGLEHV